VDFSKGDVRSFAVSGDGHTTVETQNLVADVDVLFQEIYTFKKKVPVHMDFQTFYRWAKTSRIGRIGVAHHARTEVSTVHRRVSAMSRKDPRWFSLEPGMVVSL
jgi:hypothetical protein